MPGLAASLALHAVLVAAVLAALPRSELLPPLFVDLTVADPGAERASPRGGSTPPPSSRRRVVAPPPAERRPESPAPAPPSSAQTTLPSLIAEPSAPVPPPPPMPALSSPSNASSEDATAPAPSAPALTRERGARSAPETSGRRTLAEAPGHDDASGIGVAASPDLDRTRPHPDDGGRGGAGAGPQLARRSPGSEGGDGAPAVYAEYLSRLRQRLHEALRYPPAARRRGLTGAVTIELTILPSGLIRDVSVVTSSSHPLLDDAAVETVRELRAQPFPASLPPRTLRVRLPVVFQLE